MKPTLRLLSRIILATFLAALPPLAAQDSDIATSYRSQSDLRQQAERIIAHIDTIIFDYTRNGLVGEELEALKRTRKKLSQSSDSEMARILELLAAAEQDEEGEERLLEAFEGQKGVLAVLRELMSEYNQRRDMAAIPLGLRSILERQQSNLAAATQLAPSINPNRGLTEFQKRMVDAQYEEQRDINQEFTHWVASMEILAFSTEEDTAARFQRALAEIQRMRVPGILRQSLDALDAEQVVTAASIEERAVDALESLLVTLDKEPPAPQDEPSFDLTAELKRILEDEKNVRKQIDKRIERDQNLKPVANKQGKVLQAFYRLRDAMIERMPERSDLHKTILDGMRLARRQMSDKAPSRRAQSAGTVDQIIAQLDGLIGLAAEAAAAADANEETAEEEDGTFAERLEKTVSEQETLNRNTLALERNGSRLHGARERQETIGRMTSILHDQARSSYPEAARPLFDAAEDIRKALANLTVEGREGLAIMAQEATLNHLRQALAALETEETEPPETDPSLLAEGIEQAQAELEATEAAIEEEDLEEAAEELEDAVEAVAEAEELAEAMDPTMIPEDLQEDLDAAGEALAEAMAALPTAAEAGEMAEDEAAGEETEASEASPLDTALAAAAAALEQASSTADDMAEGEGEGESEGESEFLEGIAAQLAQGMPGDPTGEGEGEGQEAPPGPPQPGATPMTDTESDGEGEGEYNSAGPEVAGTPGELDEESAFTDLPERDREAIRQSRSEPHPAAYRDFIEQYRRNLAESMQ